MLISAVNIVQVTIYLNWKAWFVYFICWQQYVLCSSLWPPHGRDENMMSDQRKRSRENWQTLNWVTQQRSNWFPSICEVKWESHRERGSESERERERGREGKRLHHRDFQSDSFLSHLLKDNWNTHLMEDYKVRVSLTHTRAHTHTHRQKLTHIYRHTQTILYTNHLPGSICTFSVGNPINFHSRGRAMKPTPDFCSLRLCLCLDTLTVEMHLLWKYISHIQAVYTYVLRKVNHLGFIRKYK